MHSFQSFNTLSKTSKHLKNAFIVSLFLFICFFLYISSSLAINKVKKTIEEQYTEDGKNLVRAYSLAFQNMITQSNLTLDMYATNEVIQNGTTEEIAYWLKNHTSMRPQTFIETFYCNTKGDLFTDSGNSINVSDRDYYKAILTEKYVYYLGTAVYSKTNEKKIIQVIRTIYNKDGSLKGFLGGAIELSQLQKLLASIQITNAMEPFILDNNGLCMSNIKDTAFMKPFTPEDVKYKEYETKKLSQKDIPLFNSINEKGEKVHVFTEKIKDINWTIGVSILDEQIYETYNELSKAKKIVFLIVILSCFIFYILTVVTLKYIRKKYDATQKKDPLTDLNTRQNLESEASKLIKQYPKNNFVLIESDFNGFKFINRNYGEKVGNDTLCTYADALKKIVFKFGGFAARGYADHFYYFNEIVSLQKFKMKLLEAQRIIEETSRKARYPFVVKYGISFFQYDNLNSDDSDRKTISQLIGEASIAKNTIKKDTEENYAVFDIQLSEKVRLEQQIEKNMENALAKEEFFVVYQPKINLLNDRIIGAEALVRWNSPELGFLTPDKFIPIFESNGFIKKLDFAVYEMVFKFIKQQIEKNNPIVPISINMSRIHVNTKTFMKEFIKRFEKYSIPEKYIEIEILERSVNNEKPILKEITDALHKRGFTVAMDDFGSGESSLNMLNSVPIDVLKFDQNFLRKNNESEKTEQFITSLIKMAQQLQKKTVFEGVETEEQRDFLKSIKCDSVQGFFYSKPLLEEDFIKFIKNH